MDREPGSVLECKGRLSLQPVFPDPQSGWDLGKHALLGIEAVVQDGRTQLWPTVRRTPYQWPGVLHYQDHDDQPFMQLHNSGGGFIEGDIAQFRLDARAGSRVLMTTTGANRFYKCENGGHCEDHVEVHLGADCLFEYLPDEVIPYRRSAFTRSTRIAAARSARVFVSDVITSGRQYHGAQSGEAFAFDVMRSETGLEIDGRLVWLDRLIADTPDAVGALEALWGGHGCMATMLAYAEDLPADLCDRVQDVVASLGHGKGGVTFIDGNLLCVRLLVDDAWRAHEATFAIWSVVRPSIAGKPARVISKP